MADSSSAPVNTAAQQPPADPLATTAGETALPKNPFNDSQASKQSEPTPSAALGNGNPLPLAPEIHQPADTPAATANGGSAAPRSTAPSFATTNGAANETGVAMPKAPMGADSDPLPPSTAETPKGSIPSSGTGKPQSSLFGSPSKSAAVTNSAIGGTSDASTSAPAQPPVMTGALPLAPEEGIPAASAPQPAESTEHDGVKDTTAEPLASKTDAPDDQNDGGKDASAKAVGAPNGGEQEDTETKDTAPAGVSASNAASTGAGLDSLSDEKRDIEMADATPFAAAASTTNPSTTDPITAPSNKENVEMKDAGPSAPSDQPPVPSEATASADKREAGVKEAAPSVPQAPTSAPEAPEPVTASASDVTGKASTSAAHAPAVPATASVGEPVTGKKRKADEVDETREDAAEEASAPPAKKHKGPFAKVIAKAKEAVHDVKEKATPKRKASKKEKKERLPVGRTERKTRSQAKAE